MSRPVLSLYALDRAELAAFSGELRTLLSTDDRRGLAKLLGLGAEMAGRVEAAPRAVELFLRDEEDPEMVPLFASLRRVAKKRSLSLAWTSEAPSLEGRLRAYDLLREDEEVARAIDKMLASENIPWFLRRPGATAGWLSETVKNELAEKMEELGPALPEELEAFGRALSAVDGDALVHDRLEAVKP